MTDPLSDGIFNPNLFEGTKILVVGASGGIGWACASMMATLGASVVVTARRAEKLNLLVGALPQHAGQKHVAIVADWAGFEQSKAAAKQILSEHGRFDGLVFSAGCEVIVNTRAMTIADIRNAYDASVFGLLGLASVMMSKRFWSESGGGVVIVSSVAAHRGRQGMLAYSSAKASILGAVRSLAVELAPLRVRINSLACGAVQTDMHERVVNRMPEAAVSAYEAAHQLGIGQPLDVANAAAFFLSPAGRWVTGSELTMDGGYLA